MLNLRYLPLFIFCALAAACAPFAVKQPAPAAEEAAAVKAVKLPQHELSEQILYELLLAEIAGQRGDLGLATEAYLDLAKSTRDPRLAQRATEVALYSKLEQQALQAATLWLEVAPETLQARQTVAALLLGSGRLAEARPHLERLIAGEGESRGNGFLYLGNLLARQKDRQGALELMRSLAKPYPRIAEAHFAVAQIAWNAEQHELALQETGEALDWRPGWEGAALFRGQLLQQSSLPQALEFYRDFLDDYPRSREVRLAYARLLASDKQYLPAREQFRRLQSDFPDNAEISFAAGLLSMQLGDFDAAEASLKQALELNHKDDDLVRWYLGQLNEERRRPDEALIWYGSVVSGDHYLSAQIRYAAIEAKQGRLAEARQRLQQLAPQNNQQRVQLIQAEAQLLHETKADREAFELLGQALEKLPNYPELLYDYAMAAEKVDRLDILEQSLRKLIQLKPDSAHAYNALGYTLADRTDRFQEAQELLEKALSLAPDDAFIMDSMGWLQYRLGQHAKALGYLRRAYASRPDPEIAAHLGEVLWVQGERGEAEKIWYSALKDNPQHEMLLRVIKKFKPQ